MTAKPKSSPQPEPDAAPKTTAKKRYTPTKPSTVAKIEPKPAPVHKHAEDQPPETQPSSTFPAEPPQYTPPTSETTEANLKTGTSPLSGGLDSAPVTTTTGLSPTIGGSEVDLTPRDTEPTPSSSFPKVTTTSQPSGTGTTTDVGSKSSGSFLVGKKGSKPGRVVSPYAPFNELDITGLPTGSLALDPTTQKVFEVP